MATPHAGARSARPGSSGAYAELHAMADLVRRTGCVVHLVVPRAPGIADQARAVALTSGLDVSVDLRPHTTHVRFSG